MVKLAGSDWFDGSDACVERLGREARREADDGEFESDELLDDGE
jgi:hypothetical protein